MQMPAGRPNIIDSHPDKLLILKELFQKKSHRSIAAKFGMSVGAVDRYSKREMRRYIVNGVDIAAPERNAVRAESDRAASDIIMSDISAIRGHSHKLMDSIMSGMPANGKMECDPKGFAAVTRGLLCAAELQARLEGRLDTAGVVRVQVNIGLLGALPGAPAAAPDDSWPTGETIDAGPVLPVR